MHALRRRLLAALLTLGCLACGPRPADRDAARGSAPDQEPPLELPSLLVGTSWLNERSDHPRLVILDTRPEENYRAGHVPGSVSLPTTVTFDAERADKLPRVPEVERLLSDAGIDAGKTVVVYDQGELRWAARVLWMLEVHGHQRVAVLDGGYDRWRKEGLPVSTSTHRQSPANFVANVAPEHLASLLQTRQSLDDPRTVIVDARSPEEYAGEEDRWPRNGHIPGAINVEWLRNLNDSGGAPKLRQASDLRTLYPYEPDTRFITYCTRGRRAAVSYLALRLAGFEAAVYDGSWNEWASHSEVPVAQPEAADETPDETPSGTPAGTPSGTPAGTPSGTPAEDEDGAPSLD